MQRSSALHLNSSVPYWFFGFSVIDAIEDFDLLTDQFLNENRELLG